MAILDFPASPTVGQRYSFSPYIYEWDGVKWKTISAGYNPTEELRNDLAEDTGAGMIGTSSGNTVQEELDGKVNKIGDVMNGNLTAPVFIGALTGNASTATSAATLTTARTIS